jgi:hypothetical protein
MDGVEALGRLVPPAGAWPAAANATSASSPRRPATAATPRHDRVVMTAI